VRAGLKATSPVPRAHPEFPSTGDDGDDALLILGENPVIPEAPRVRAVHVLAIMVAVGLMAKVIWDADWAQVSALLRNAGPQVAFVIVPFAFGMMAATGAWATVLVQLGFLTSLGVLFRLRLGAEAVLLTVPGGSVISDALRPWWLKRRLGIPVPEGAASVVLSKALIIQAEGLYLLIAVALGGSAAQAIFAGVLSGFRERFPGSFGVWVQSWGWVLVLGLGLVLLGAGTGFLAVLSGGKTTRRVVGLIARLPLSAVKRWAVRSQESVASMDESLRRFFGPGGRVAAFVGVFVSLGVWLAEAIETYVIFWVLGIEVSFPTALVIESIGSAIRAAVFFVPAGVGVQDVGTVLMLKAVGVPDASSAGAAFMLTKRSKEIFWIVAGYSLLLAKRRRHEQHP